MARINLEEKAMFHGQETSATNSAAGFVCCSTAKSQMFLRKTLNSPAYLLDAAQERFEVCVITLNPKELVHREILTFKDRYVPVVEV